MKNFEKKLKDLEDIVSKLKSGELPWINMINIQTLEFDICLSVSDMAEFRAKNSYFKDEDFLYTHFTTFEIASYRDLYYLVEELTDNIDSSDEIPF